MSTHLACRSLYLQAYNHDIRYHRTSNARCCSNELLLIQSCIEQFSRWQYICFIVDNVLAKTYDTLYFGVSYPVRLALISTHLCYSDSLHTALLVVHVNGPSSSVVTFTMAITITLYAIIDRRTPDAVATSWSAGTLNNDPLVVVSSITRRCHVSELWVIHYGRQSI